MNISEISKTIIEKSKGVLEPCKTQFQKGKNVIEASKNAVNNKLELIDRYRGFNNFLSILNSKKDESLNMLLGGYSTANINEEDNYLEIFYDNGNKARITFTSEVEKGLIDKTIYNYSIRLRKNNSLYIMSYETNRNKLAYSIYTKEDDCYSKYNGEISTKGGKITSILAESKSYTYDRLRKVKPSCDFKNESLETCYRNIKDLGTRNRATYESTFDLAVFDDKAYFKYNNEADETLIKDYDRENAIKVAFHSYINGHLRPANALIEENKEAKTRSLR